MKPSKKRPEPGGPDRIKGETGISENTSGTEGDTVADEQLREQGLEGDEGSGGGYGRPRGDDDEDERA